jgi:hypothetical protein
MIRVGRNYDGNNVHPAKLSGQARTALSCIISPSLPFAAPRTPITYSGVPGEFLIKVTPDYKGYSYNDSRRCNLWLCDMLVKHSH